MKIPSGVTDQYIYFVAVDSTDLKTRETGLSSFTVYRSRDGAAAVAMTTPTINETDSSNMPGVYELLLDEDMTIGSGNDTEEMVFHITQASMAPVTRTIELYRPKITTGYTLGVESDGDLTKVNTLNGHTAQTADHTAGIADVPTVSEFNARTLATADYFDPTADTVANVTTVGTTTTNADMRGTDGAYTGTPPTASEIVNEWETQSQADPTGFHVNLLEVGGDGTAVTNLAAGWDGTTGVSGDTFPSTQGQVNNIGAASGGAINIEATEDNTGGAIIDSVTFVGSVTSGTFADTNISGGSHAMNDTGNIIDIVYGIDIGGARTATGVTILANLNGNTDEIVVETFDPVGSAWDEIDILSGSGGSTYTALNPSLLAKHTGTGAELGKVYIRFRTDSTSPNSLDVKLLLVSAVSTSTSVGYAKGSYWIDENGTAGTEIGANGTADNPCPWANALTMNATQPLNRFQIANGTTVTLSATAADYTLAGDAWSLVLDAYSIDGASITGAASVTSIGTATISANEPIFKDCHFGACTVPPSKIDHCGVGKDSGTLTHGGAGAYDFHECYSLVPGSGSPAMAFAGTGSTTTIGNRAWTGGINYTLDSDCTLSHEVLAGGGTTITTGGGDAEIRGICRSLAVTVSASETVQFVGVTGPITITDSGSTAPTINLYGVCSSLTDGTGSANDYTISNDSINAEADTALTDYGANTTTPPTAAAIVNEWESQSQSDPTGFRVNVMEVNGTAQTANDNGADINTLIGNQGNWATATGFSTHSAADIWTAGTRTLTSFGTLIADIWAYVTRTLTAGGDATEAKQNTIIANLATAQTDLDTVTGTDGTTLATSQPNYAPNIVVPMAAALSQTEHNDTQSTLAGLNDLAATDIVSNGAITTLAGAIVNVDLVDLTTANTDMRGTDSANTVVPMTAALSQTEHDATQSSIASLNDFDPTSDTVANVTLVGTTTTNTDMRGTDSAATAAALATHDGKLDTVDGIVDAILIDTGTDIPARFDGVEGATFATGTDSLEAIRDRGDAAWTTGGGGSAPTEADIYAHFISGSNEDAFKADVSGLATSAELATHDGKLDTVDGIVDGILVDTGTTLPATLTTIEGKVDTVDTVADGIKAVTDNLPDSGALSTIDANVGAVLVDTGTTLPAQITALNNISPADVNAQMVDVLTVDVIADSYAADGTQPTIAQAVLAIQQFLMEKAVSGTTVTMKKPDGSTSAMTFTLDDANTPTSITRAS